MPKVIIYYTIGVSIINTNVVHVERQSVDALAQCLQRIGYGKNILAFSDGIEIDTNDTPFKVVKSSGWEGEKTTSLYYEDKHKNKLLAGTFPRDSKTWYSVVKLDAIAFLLENNDLPSDLIFRNVFYDAYRASLQAGRKKYSVFFKVPSLDPSLTLSEILQDARANPYSKEICRSLGWICKDGSLTLFAPHEVQEAFHASCSLSSWD